jgi:hypothetical protein
MAALLERKLERLAAVTRIVHLDAVSGAVRVKPAETEIPIGVAHRLGKLPGTLGEDNARTGDAIGCAVLRRLQRAADK